MESEGNGGPARDHGSASRGGRPREALSKGLFGRLLDKILLASWVFSYALILRVFRVLKSFENGMRSPRRKN